MVEADSQLKLLPTSILDIYKMIEHIDMLALGIQYQPYTVIPTLLGSDFWALCHLRSQHDVIMSWLKSDSHLKLLPTSILDIYKVFEHIAILSTVIE
jgi:hypothetical protein